jgi:3-phenylpropionate/trans-cinnamate dioxygenase ferredoxin subunit
MPTATVRFIDVGPLSAFPVGEMRKVDIPGKDIYVLRTPDERYYAIKNTCPHHGAPICLGSVRGTFVPSAPGVYQLGMEYSVIRCPHHAYEYDLETGLPAFINATDRVVRYDVKVEDGRVLVSSKGK